jgi:hypothetical protein
MDGWAGGKAAGKGKRAGPAAPGRLLCFILLFYSLAINPSNVQNTHVLLPTNVPTALYFQQQQ